MYPSSVLVSVTTLQGATCLSEGKHPHTVTYTNVEYWYGKQQAHYEHKIIITIYLSTCNEKYRPYL